MVYQLETKKDQQLLVLKKEIAAWTFWNENLNSKNGVTGVKVKGDPFVIISL